jgi:hypothetical protein
MAQVDKALIQKYLEIGTKKVVGKTAKEQGAALEDLICYLFALVPGISITHRDALNVKKSQEIDVALWNDKDPDGFHYLPNIILIECKSWDKRVGSEQVSWFNTKLRDRGLAFGILIAIKGLSGNAGDMTSAHDMVGKALAEGRQLIVLTSKDLIGLAESTELVHLVKLKLCNLAVRGDLA